MKNKSIFAIAVLCATIVTLFTACDSEVPMFFELSSVNAPTGIASTEKINRYFGQYTDSFAPSSEYGELVPFVGDVLTYSPAESEGGEVIKKPLYGLCTTSGAVVVDPVYDNVFTHKLNGICLYELLIGSDKRELAGTRLLIPSNGSWMMELPAEKRVSTLSGNGLFAVERDKVVKRNRKKVTITYYDFYGLDGNLAFTFDKKLTEAVDTKFTLGNYSDELMNVNVTVTSESVEKDEQGKDVAVINEEKNGYYVDISGKIAFKKLELLKAEPFYDGLAVVVSKDGKYGVLKSDGKYFIEPKFNIINRNEAEGYFACGTDGYFSIVNNNGDEVTKIYCENADVKIIGTEKLIYKKTLKYSGKTEYFSVYPEGAFICKETGQFPDADTGEFGIFTCSYSGVTDVFDTSGESLAQFTDLVKVCGAWGNCAVVEGKSGGVWVVDIANGEKSEQIEGRFVQAHADGKYIVVENNGMFVVYGFEEQSVIIENADYIIQNRGLLCVREKGYVTLYGDKMQVLMRYCCEAEVSR